MHIIVIDNTVLNPVLYVLNELIYIQIKNVNFIRQSPIPNIQGQEKYRHSSEMKRQISTLSR